jgi:hypothetical protein
MAPGVAQVMTGAAFTTSKEADAAALLKLIWSVGVNVTESE